ncbi:MAG: histidine kinase dimerization/phospho-acceptor domain-containing protein, partial [Actinomycetota bacterium]
MPLPAPAVMGDMSRLDPTHERLTQAIEELSRIQLELDSERLVRAEGEVRFDATLASMSDALLITDPKGEISLANEGAARLFGVRSDELVGSQVAGYLPEGVPSTPMELLEAAPNGTQMSMEANISTPSGTVPVSISIGMVRDRAGKLLGTVYAARDLSETQRLAHELDKERDRWRSLARVNDHLVQGFDPHSSLHKVCEELAMETSLGVAMIVVTDGTVRSVVADDRASTALADLPSLEGRPLPPGSSLRTSFEKGMTIHSPTLKQGFPLLGPATALGPIASAAVLPLTSGDSTVGAMLLVGEEPEAVTDEYVTLGLEIAARVAATLSNAELRSSLAHMEAIQEASKAREEMVASISHDMKTPLTVLLGSLDMLQNSPNTPPEIASKLYAAMGRQASNLSRLVQQFLDYTRLESGRELVLRPGAVDLGAAIRKVVADLESQATFELDLPPDLPNVFADLDRVD